MDKQTCQRLETASARALEWLRSHLHDDGSYGDEVKDLACYYKLPYLFLLHGQLREANRLLTFIKTTFMQETGDFTTSGPVKSENPAFNEYWAYINGWIVLAAQKLGRFDVACPGYRYLASFHVPALDGFATHRPEDAADGPVDVLTTAHLGLTALYCGDLAKAEGAGRLLERFVDAQPDPRSAFFLRLDRVGEPITRFPEDASIFFAVSARQPQQAYFMIGYPIAFLAKLYQATGRDRSLQTAGRYLDFALSCNDSLRSFHFSHKVAWGAALVARLTGAARYRDLALAIVDHLLAIQGPDGSWLGGEPEHVRFDQTAEIAIWLKEISAELGS